MQPGGQFKGTSSGELRHWGDWEVREEFPGNSVSDVEIGVPRGHEKGACHRICDKPLAKSGRQGAWPGRYVLPDVVALPVSPLVTTEMPRGRVELLTSKSV